MKIFDPPSPSGYLNVVVFVHGFRVGDPLRLFKKMILYLTTKYHYRCVVVDYGRQMWGTRNTNRQLKYELARVIDELSIKHGNVSIVMHSNGCYVGLQATHVLNHATNIPTAWFFNPAMDPGFIPGPRVEKWHVVYSRYDKAVSWARWIPNSGWGNAGQVGYVPLIAGERDRRYMPHDESGKKLRHSGFAEREDLWYEFARSDFINRGQADESNFDTVDVTNM